MRSAGPGSGPSPGERWIRTVCRIYPADFRALLEEDLVARYRAEGERIRRERGGLAARAWSVRTLAALAWGGLFERARTGPTAGPGTTTPSTDGRGIMLETWWGDLRVAARALATRTPGFTIVAVSTLALGVAANTTVFSVVDGVLLRPLPYPDAHELVQIWELDDEGGRNAVTAANLWDWNERNRTFEWLVVRSNPAYGGEATVLGGAEPVRAEVARVGRGFFEMMAVPPMRGRGFEAADHLEGTGLVAVVSRRFWESQLGATTDLAARPLEISGYPATVVGVMPAGFDFPQGTEVWVPMSIEPGGSRTSHNWLATGRLRDGVDPADARADLDRITTAIRAVHASDMTAVATEVVPLQEQLFGDMARPLALLLGAAGFVLLVGCTNLASTLLARGRNRAGELAVRAGLGASRGRIVRQLLTESALLAAVGSALGALLTFPALRLVLAAGPPRLEGYAVVDGRVLGVTLAAGSATALLFGVYPALVASRSDLATTLRQGGRAGSERRGLAWDALVSLEVAMALVLLAGTSVLLRSFGRVLAVDPGFAAERIVTLEMSFGSSDFPDDAARADGMSDVLTNLRQTPGVRSAGLVNHLPLGGVSFNGGFETPESGGEVAGNADYRVASAGYFESMGIPVLQGRAFEDGDDGSRGDVAIVSRAMAERYWPDRSPVGAQIRNLRNDAFLYPDRWITIVGVVGDILHRELTQPAQPTVYVNALQRPGRAASPVLVARVEGDPARVAPRLREAVRRAVPATPVRTVSMEDRVAASVTDRRFTLLVLGAFAVVALILAAVGIYGVVSYTVARRTREMGIRIALGAPPAGVLRSVLATSLRAVGVGTALGAVGALAMGRVLSGLVYGVAPTDAASLLASVLALLAVATAATLVPGARATRVDPLLAMRAE